MCLVATIYVLLLHEDFFPEVRRFAETAGRRGDCNNVPRSGTSCAALSDSRSLAALAPASVLRTWQAQ